MGTRCMCPDCGKDYDEVEFHGWVGCRCQYIVAEDAVFSGYGGNVIAPTHELSVEKAVRDVLRELEEQDAT